MESHDQLLRTLVIEIERHLAENEGAADSAEGVRAWWLPPLLRGAPLEQVIAALDQLEKRNVIEKRSVGAGFLYVSVRHIRTSH